MFAKLRPAVLLCLLSAVGCHAQSSAAGPASAASSAGLMSPALERRVEVLIRSRSNVPPNYSMSIEPKGKSELPGFNVIEVNFSADGKTSKPVRFLLSEDGKTLAQFTRYDISVDPKQLISATGRPARGGPNDAPVTIVGYDDLECPFCAKMHEAMFPAITQRYGSSVHIVYKDFPLSQHPWAMRAAIDVNCVGAQSTDGYWNLVDHIHQHASELGGAEKSVATADATLDNLAREEGKRSKVDEAKLNACIAKQDDTAVQSSLKEGETLGVDSTPALYVNGEKFQGAYPITDLFRMIDEALLAQGKTPPPPAPGEASPGGGKPAS